MRILLLGAKGMLGSMLRQVLGEYEVTAWDKDELDITKEAEVRDKIVTLRQAQGNDDFVIVNATGFTNVDGAEDAAQRDVCFSVNEKAVANVASVAKELDAIMVHYSTDYVFPGDKKTGYAEDDAPGPAVNVYGQSKLAGERALKESGAKFYLLRTAWLYGTGGKNFVNTMLALGKERSSGPSTDSGLPPLQVVDDQHGSPTFTKDVALATRELLTHQEQYSPGIYHAVNFGETTWYGFAKKIFEIAGMNVDVRPTTSDKFVRPAKRPKYSILKNTRGPKLRHWQDALEEYLT